MRWRSVSKRAGGRQQHHQTVSAPEKPSRADEPLEWHLFWSAAVARRFVIMWAVQVEPRHGDGLARNRFEGAGLVTNALVLPKGHIARSAHTVDNRGGIPCAVTH